MIDAGPGSFFLPSLDSSPSSAHGIDLPSESRLRFLGCQLIQEAGILLRLPQAAMATGQVLLHRFFCKQSFKEFDARDVALSCTWLAMKLEEVTVLNGKSRLPDLLRVFQTVCRRHRLHHEQGSCLDLSASVTYRQVKTQMLALEHRILVELGFVCHVEHPHKFLLSYLKCLEASPELIQEAWNLANDSLRTTLCVKYPSNIIASGVIYAAARRLGVPLPERESNQWWLLFDTTTEQILDVCRSLALLYRQEKVLSSDIEKLTCGAQTAFMERRKLIEEEAEGIPKNSSDLPETKPSPDAEACPYTVSGRRRDIGLSNLPEGEVGCRPFLQGSRIKETLVAFMVATTKGHSENVTSKLETGEVVKILSEHLSGSDPRKHSNQRRREREQDEAIDPRKIFKASIGHSAISNKVEDRQDRGSALHSYRSHHCRTEKRRYNSSRLEDSYRSRGTEVYLSSHRRRRH